MKVLIMSCSTGEGHNSAARAIKEEFDARGIENALKDPVSFGGKSAQHAVASGYNNIIRISPPVFGAIYKLGALYYSTGITSPIYAANASYSRALYDYVCEGGFDAIVSSHLYGMEATAAMRKRFGLNIPSYGVLTDYTVIPFFTEPELDGYFIPHEEIRPQMKAHGVPDEKVFATGIPVSRRFYSRIPMDEARAKLGISQERKMMLVMSGGVGGGNLPGLCDALAKAADASTDIYVMTGRNERMRNYLNDRYRYDPRIRSVAFTREVNLYMNAANVLLSKPGGLSSTEAASANVPLIHINTIPGCETCNVQFFLEHGMALPAKNVSDAARLAVRLAGDDKAAEAMRQRQRDTIDPRAAESIVDIMLAQAQEREQKKVKV